MSFWLGLVAGFALPWLALLAVLVAAGRRLRAPGQLATAPPVVVPRVKEG